MQSQRKQEEKQKRDGVFDRRLCVTREQRKQTEEEQKGEMEKAKERKGPPRGRSRLPGNALPRKLMPVKEKKELKKKVWSIEGNPPKPQAEVLLYVMN